jgi:glutamate carboxypeptidase
MPLSALEQKVCDRIAQRRAALLDDLRLHVEIPTGLNHTPGLAEARERFSARACALGAALDLVPGEPRPWWLGGPVAMRAHLQGAPVAPVPPTAVLRRLRHTGKRAALISGHLDTVHDPAGPFRALSIAPDGRTATGPGCVDMKGGLVIAMAALEALDEAGAEVNWTLVLNSDEETGSFASGRALHHEAASGWYSAGLALEPAMAKGELAISRGGSGQFMLQAKGRAAHVGRDFTSGVSATEALARAILGAHALSDAAKGVCVNVSPLWCDVPTNMVADHAAAWGNLRYPDAPTEAAVRQGLEALARGTSADLPEVTVQGAFARPAKPMTPEVETLGLRARAAAEDLGQRLPFAHTAGVCDGNNLQAAGLPTIDTLGVRGGGLHTPQEWIELPSLVERCQLLAVLLLRLSV